ncbi:MAG: orotate phosphoribosyltransferase, partial [Nitrososphaerota archaeon]
MSLKNRVIEILLSIGCVKFGEFILSSGIKSNVYVDLRRIISYPREFKEIALISSEFLRNLE